MNDDLTNFQRSALNKLRHIGGSIFYASDRSWTDKHGERVSVPSADFKTDGFIGWPTIRALVSADVLYHRTGNEYALTSKAPVAQAAA